jgi:hypothetical protein
MDRFFIDERDLFTFFFGIFLLVALFLKIPLLPFRGESLLVLFFFLVVARAMVGGLRYESFLFIVLSGVLFSLFLSPYGLAIYLIIAMFIYSKTQRV